MIYEQTPVYNYQNVSIVVNNTQSRYYFPDLPNLRDVKTFAISAYQNNQFPIDINSVPLISPSQLAHSFITLYADGREVFQRLDLMYLNVIKASDTTSGAYPQYNTSGSLPLDNLKLDFSKSFIEFNSGYTGGYSGTTFCFNFGVYYIK